MAKPKISTAEVELVIQQLDQLNKDGQSSVIFFDIKDNLALGDQTIERFRNLIVPALQKQGFSITLDGSEIHWKKETMNDIPQEQNSNRTQLEHSYVTPPNYKDLFTSIHMGDHPLLYGPPGCGKSLCAEYIGYELGESIFNRPDYKVTRVGLGDHISAADLIGETLLVDSPKGGVITRYVYGHITEAVEKGYMVILDEISMMGPEANSALQRITESGGKMVIKTENGTVVLNKHPHYRLVFTDNTQLTGDSTGMFGGTQTQNYAFRDRIPTVFGFDYLPDYELSILMNDYHLPPAVCEMLYGTSSGEIKPDKGIINILRNACKNGTIEAFVSMRMIMEFARHYKAFNGINPKKCHSWHKAMFYCFVNKFPPQFQNIVLETFQTTCGVELVPTNNRVEIEKHTDFLKTKGFFPLANTYMPKELQ